MSVVDDVLRLKATIETEEGLAKLREWGREVGYLPNKVKPQINSLSTMFAGLGKTIQGVGREITAVIPSLGGFGLGAASAGIAAGLLLRTFNDMSKRMVELKYSAKELGMSEREIRGWSEAAEQVGISSQSMVQGIRGFRNVLGGLQTNFGGVRDSMLQMGLGPFLAQIKSIKDPAQQLVEVFKFKDTLLTLPNGLWRAQQLFDIFGIGSDKVRITADEAAKSLASMKPIPEDVIESAKKYGDALLHISNAWDRLTLRAFGGGLVKGAEAVARFLDELGDEPPESVKKMNELLDAKRRGRSFRRTTPEPEAAPPTPEASPPPVAPEPIEPGSVQDLNRRRQQQHGGASFKPMSFDGFGDSDSNYEPSGFKVLSGGLGGAPAGLTGGGMSEGSRMIKEGVFQALVDFQSYVQAGGVQNASLGGFGGPGAGLPGGGGGGGGGQPGGYGGPRSGSPAQSSGPGGPGGITAPTGTPVVKEGLATVTTPSGKKFEVDARFAANFQGFLADYEKAGGVLGPNTGTLGTRGNPSGHPIGDAIDINQLSRHERGGGVSLPLAVEEQLADKWGLVAGSRWHDPDPGHFGVRSFEAARQALIRNGVDPGQASAIAAKQTGGPGGGTTVKGSVFGPAPGWPRDPTQGGLRGPSGLSIAQPGIALPSKAGLGQMFEVTTPDGRKFMLPQVDIGPFAKGRGIDITAAAAAQMGYGPKDFPTDQPFTYRRIDQHIAGGQKVDGSVNVQINSNGTSAQTRTRNKGPLFQKTKVTSTNNPQMQPTQTPQYEEQE
jgi:hypothetical protein